MFRENSSLAGSISSKEKTLITFPQELQFQAPLQPSVKNDKRGMDPQEQDNLAQAKPHALTRQGQAQQHMGIPLPFCKETEILL